MPENALDPTLETTTETTSETTVSKAAPISKAELVRRAALAVPPIPNLKPRQPLTAAQQQAQQKRLEVLSESEMVEFEQSYLEQCFQNTINIARALGIPQRVLHQIKANYAPAYSAAQEQQVLFKLLEYTKGLAASVNARRALVATPMPVLENAHQQLTSQIAYLDRRTRTFGATRDKGGDTKAFNALRAPMLKQISHAAVLLCRLYRTYIPTDIAMPSPDLIEMAKNKNLDTPDIEAIFQEAFEDLVALQPRLKDKVSEIEATVKALVKQCYSLDGQEHRKKEHLMQQPVSKGTAPGKYVKIPKKSDGRPSLERTQSEAEIRKMPASTVSNFTAASKAVDDLDVSRHSSSSRPSLERTASVAEVRKMPAPTADQVAAASEVVDDLDVSRHPSNTNSVSETPLTAERLAAFVMQAGNVNGVARPIFSFATTSEHNQDIVSTPGKGAKPRMYSF